MMHSPGMGMGFGMGFGMIIMVIAILLVGIAIGLLLTRTGLKAKNMLLITGLVLLVLFGWWYFAMNRSTHVSSANDGGIVNGDDAMVAVTVPELGPAAQAGKAVFEANCAACHGANAAGRKGNGPPLVHIIYETSHHGDAAFYLAAKNGVRAHHWSFGNMPAVPGLSDEDISAIVTYVRTLQRANGIN